MVMYNIASNLDGIFRRIGKATEWKIDCKKPSVNLRFSVNNAGFHGFKNVQNFEAFEYIISFILKWELI